MAEHHHYPTHTQEKPLFTSPPSAPPPTSNPTTHHPHFLHNTHTPLVHPPRRPPNPCLRCICAVLAAALIACVIAAFLFYLIVHPRSPKYRVQDVRISEFSLSNQTSPAGGPYLTSSAAFTVIARNPNKRIGIYYDEVDVGVYFEDEQIGSGFIPPFYQGHKSTAVMVVNAEGHSTPLDGDAGSKLRSAMEKGSSVFLRARIEEHVRLKIGKLKSRHAKLVVKCDVELILPSLGIPQQLLWSRCKLHR